MVASRPQPQSPAPALAGRGKCAPGLAYLTRRYQALPVSERGAWLKSQGFLIYATKKEVSVIQGDVRGTAHLG